MEKQKVLEILSKVREIERRVKSKFSFEVLRIREIIRRAKEERKLEEERRKRE